VTFRDAYVIAADSVIELLSKDEVAARWDQPSALDEWTVAGLAGHLAGQVFTGVELLEAEPADQPPIPVDEHYARAAWVGATLDEEVNVGIRGAGTPTRPRDTRTSSVGCWLLGTAWRTSWRPRPRTGSC
jgi:hypothetical protein